MAKLESKIDFVALVSVTRANGNGDPLDGNRPRTITASGKSRMCASSVRSATGCRIWATRFLCSPTINARTATRP